MGKKKRIGLRAYARHRGCSPSAVSRAIRDGRLKESVKRDERGHPKIDADLADAEWGSTTDTGRAPISRGEADVPAAGDESEEGVRQLGGACEQSGGLTFAEARATKEYWSMLLTKLEYKKRAGELTYVEEVRRATFEIMRSLRNCIQGIPSRTAARLAATSEEHGCYTLLMEEINEILNDFADSLEKATTPQAEGEADVTELQ